MNDSRNIFGTNPSPSLATAQKNDAGDCQSHCQYGVGQDTGSSFLFGLIQSLSKSKEIVVIINMRLPSESLETGFSSDSTSN